MVSKFLFCIVALAVLTFPVTAQRAQQIWGPATSIGAVGVARDNRNYGGIPNNFTIDWFQGGVTPSVCTFRVEGSSDGLHWNDLSGTQDCTGQLAFAVSNKPVAVVRVNVLTFTGATSQVFFNFTRATAGGN